MVIPPRLLTEEIAIDRIDPDPQQPRKRFNKDSISELAESFARVGLINPISVCPAGDRYTILFGERRYRAAKNSGHKTIRCQIFEGNLSRVEILKRQLIEHLHRENLNPIEEAHAFAKLIELQKWNRSRLAEELNRSPASITKSLALLDLPKDIQAQVIFGVLPASTAYEVAKLKDAAAQREVTTQATSQGMTRQAVTNMIHQRTDSAEKPATGPPTASKPSRAPTSSPSVAPQRPTVQQDEPLLPLPKVTVLFRREATQDHTQIIICADKEPSPLEKVLALQSAYEQALEALMATAREPHKRLELVKLLQRYEYKAVTV